MRQFTENTEKIETGAVGDDVFVAPRADGVAGGQADEAVSAAEIDPKQARKDAINDMKRTHIMDAAVRVISRDGYMNVRLEDVAEEAGFSKASIYHYFPDKEALLIHVMIGGEQADYDRCLEAVERGMPFLDTVKAFVTVFFDGKDLKKSGGMIAGAPVSAMSSILTSMTKHEDLMKSFIKCKWGTFELMMRAVARARADGTLDSPADDVAVTTMIMSYINASFMRRLYGSWIKSFGGDGPTEGVTEPVGVIDNLDVDWVMNAISIFLEPWLKNDSPGRRWYDIQQKNTI